MPNLVEIIFKASGGSSVSGEAGKAQSGLNNLQSGVNSFIGGMRQLDSTMASLGIGVGLMSLYSSTKQWVEQAVAGAAVEARLARTFANVSGGAEQAAANLDALRTATKNQVDEGQLMATGLDVINLKLTQSPAQMQQYVAVAKRLGAEFGSMDFDAAVSGFNRIEEAGSVSARFLLQYGISADNVNARIQELQRADSSLSDTEAARQAILQEAIAVYNRLGPVQRDTIAAQKEMAAAATDFQDAFGAMVLSMGSSMGIFDAITGKLRELRSGAEAWTSVNQQTGGDNLRQLQMQVIANTGSYKEYNEAIRAAEDQAGAMGQLLFGPKLALEKSEYDALKVSVDAMRGAFNVASGDAGIYAIKLSIASSATQELSTDTGAAIGNISTFRDTLDTAAKRADMARASAQKLAAQGYKIDTSDIDKAIAKFETLINVTAGWNPSAEMAGLQAANPYAGVNVWTSRDQAEFDERQRKTDQANQEAARKQQDAVRQAADALRSTIESVMQPTLAEVWRPPEGTEARIDEDARRLAAVAMRGFGEKGWLDQLTAEYGGMGFWQPILDAMGKGDEGALKAAAANILTAQAPMLWDVPTIIDKVKSNLAQQNLREQVMQTVMAQLSGEGITVNTAQIGMAMGGGGLDMTGMLGGMKDSFTAGLASSGIGETMRTSLMGALGGTGEDREKLQAEMIGNMAPFSSLMASSLSTSLPIAMKDQNFAGAFLDTFAGEIRRDEKLLKRTSQAFVTALTQQLSVGEFAQSFLDGVLAYVLAHSSVRAAGTRP